MNRLVKIELQKVKQHTSFWVLSILYLVILFAIFFSGKFFLDFLAKKGESFGSIIDPSKIPVYAFPDVWHNIKGSPLDT